MFSPSRCLLSYLPLNYSILCKWESKRGFMPFVHAIVAAHGTNTALHSTSCTRHASLIQGETYWKRYVRYNGRFCTRPSTPYVHTTMRTYVTNIIRLVTVIYSGVTLPKNLSPISLFGVWPRIMLSRQTLIQLGIFALCLFMSDFLTDVQPSFTCVQSLSHHPPLASVTSILHWVISSVNVVHYATHIYYYHSCHLFLKPTRPVDIPGQIACP